MVEQTQTRIDADEYFELPETNLPMSLIDGVVMSSPAPSTVHQMCVGNVFFMLKQLEGTIGGVAMISPTDVRLDDRNVIQPDVLWISPESDCVISDQRLEGAPDLVVEVLSPSTALVDKTVKFQLYEQHGVQEYWLIDPIANYVEVWKRDGNRLVQQGVYGPNMTFISVILKNQQIDLSGVLTS
jgi:Uma2 family endonuclease